MVCAVKGYPFVAVMSEGNNVERVKSMRQFGARVDLVPVVGGMKGQVSGADLVRVEARFEELATELGAFRVGQFYNSLNMMAHSVTTAEEILRDVPTVDVFCDFVGTGGTFEGVAAAFKKHNPKIKCMMVEPATQKHIVQGGGYFKDVPFAVPKNCDGEIAVTDEESLFWMRELSNREGIAGGISSGTNLAAAVKYLRENPNAHIVFLVNDSFLNYASLF